MKPSFNTRYILILLIIILVSACKSYNEKLLQRETPTSGNIKIGVDESYQLLTDSQISVFEAIYKYAHVSAITAPEDSILKLFMADSIRLMITSRTLTDNELAYLKDKLVVARTTQIAWDAIAFVVHPSNPDLKIRYNTLRDIFKGETTSWKQVNPASKLGKLEVVFDNQGSANVRDIMKRFNINALPDFCYAANSNPAVIEYVEKHPGALGIIGVNWVSDPDDSITHSFLNRVKVVGITSEFYSEGDEFYTPHPAYVYDKSYPFIREVYAISRETFMGLGSGFIKFITSDQGQRIVLKSGMVPATMPVRIVQFRKQ